MRKYIGEKGFIGEEMESEDQATNKRMKETWQLCCWLSSSKGQVQERKFEEEKTPFKLLNILFK